MKTAGTGMSRAEITQVYREMQAAQQRRLEEARCEDPAARAAYLGLHDAPSSGYVEAPVTLSTFLRSMRMDDPVAEHERIRALAWAAAQDAHAELEEARAAYESAALKREAAFVHLAVDWDESYAEIARMMTGMSKQAVGSIVARARAREAAAS